MIGSPAVVGLLGDHTDSSLLELAAELDHIGSPLARTVRRIMDGGGAAEPAVARFQSAMAPDVARIDDILDPPPAR